jgi:hypothetical protein
VRAAVEGMWSRFVFGFWVRGSLYLVHLLLFSAFSAWCIAHDLSNSTVNSSQDSIVRASFYGGCVAAGICTYLLIREVMQCIACVADEGLKDYFEFWNVHCPGAGEANHYAEFDFKRRGMLWKNDDQSSLKAPSRTAAF